MSENQPTPSPAPATDAVREARSLLTDKLLEYANPSGPSTAPLWMLKLSTLLTAALAPRPDATTDLTPISSTLVAGTPAPRPDAAAPSAADAGVVGRLVDGPWILLTDRLPEENQVVLWGGRGKERPTIALAHRDGDCVVNDNWHRDVELSRFTHWMPIPALALAAAPDGKAGPA